MKTISISKKTFKELPLLDIPKEVLNTEGIIYKFNYKRQEKILKKLYNLEGPTFANKLYTLEMLNYYKQYLPTNFYVPDFLVSVNNDIKEFTCPECYGETLLVILNNKNVYYSEKIFYLKQIGFILEKLKKVRKYTPLKDFYLNDIHASNFMVNSANQEISVVDLDSCKIAANSAFPSRFLTKRSLAALIPEKYPINDDQMTGIGSFIVSEETDLYCYNMMILNYLLGGNVHNLSLEEYYEYLNYLNYIGVYQKLLDIFSKLVVAGNNENPINYLDALTKEQIYRANNIVYSRVRKKL